MQKRLSQKRFLEIEVNPPLLRQSQSYATIQLKCAFLRGILLLLRTNASFAHGRYVPW